MHGALLFLGASLRESHQIPMRMASVSSLRYLRRNRYEYLLLCASQLAVWACDCALSMCCTMHRFLAIGLFIAYVTQRRSCMYVAYEASHQSHRIASSPGGLVIPRPSLGLPVARAQLSLSEAPPVL